MLIIIKFELLIEILGKDNSNQMYQKFDSLYASHIFQLILISVFCFGSSLCLSSSFSLGLFPRLCLFLQSHELRVVRLPFVFSFPVLVRSPSVVSKPLAVGRNHLQKNVLLMGWGQSAKLGPQSAIWGKLGTALQAYSLNPCTKFPPNPPSRKVNT